MEVHLLQQSNMKTQHQSYTRNKMAVKIWTQKNSLWLYTGNINSYSVTTLTEQIVVENICAYVHIWSGKARQYRHLHTQSEWNGLL